MSDAPNNERRCWSQAHTADECWTPCVLPWMHEGPHAAAPVPSPVPPRPDAARPDTAMMRKLSESADAEGWWVHAQALRFSADWIDAHPVTDQGPDLSELRDVRAGLVYGRESGRHALAALVDAVDRLLADRDET